MPSPSRGAGARFFAVTQAMAGKVTVAHAGFVPTLPITGARFAFAIAFGAGFARPISLSGRFAAFADLWRNFLFGGAGGGEGVACQQAEREDEEGVEPGLAWGGLGDHEDALAQGGVMAHAWGQPCDGRGCEEGFLDAQQSVAVVEAFGGGEKGESTGIATQLAIGLEAIDDEPHERIEPVQRLQGGGCPVPEEVTVADMQQFVKENVAQAAGVETVLPVGRKQDARSADADERGCGAGGGEADLGFGNLGLGGELGDEGRQMRIVGQGESGELLMEAALAEKRLCKDADSAKKPEDENRMRKGEG